MVKVWFRERSWFHWFTTSIVRRPLSSWFQEHGKPQQFWFNAGITKFGGSCHFRSLINRARSLFCQPTVALAHCSARMLRDAPRSMFGPHVWDAPMGWQWCGTKFRGKVWIEVRSRWGLGINWFRLRWGFELVCTNKWKSWSHSDSLKEPPSLSIHVYLEKNGGGSEQLDVGKIGASYNMRAEQWASGTVVSAPFKAEG